MYYKYLSSIVDFSKNTIGNVEEPDTPDTPDVPDTPDIPETPDTPDTPTVPEVMPTEYSTFISSYTRSNLSSLQQHAVYTFLYKLNEAGLMSKIRQLYMPCIMPDWDHCFLNVAKYFNNMKEEYVKFDLYSSSTLGRCFEVCDYGIYRTSSEIKWGDCLTSNWSDSDVTGDNWHILMFKPAQQDATTNTHSGGLNFRSRTGANLAVNFSIGGAASTTQRVRGGWASGTLGGITMKNVMFTEPTGWGNGTHDPYCVGISIKNNKMITPSSNYQEFGYNNRNLVNEISEWPLIEGQTIPTAALTGTYGWGGYYGQSISTQQSLATSIVSIGIGLTKDEIQSYMDIANEFIVNLGIANNNWDPDNIN